MGLKGDVLERVLARVRERIPEEAAPQVERFVRQYYEWVPEEDVSDRSAIDLYGAAVSHWQLGRQRKPGEVRIRVYNPQHEEHGWQSTHTVIEIVNDDMPFLVDSVTMELNRLGHGIHLLVHPILKVRRDGEGILLDVLPQGSEGEGALAESFMHLEVDRHTEPEVLEEIRENLLRVLGDVRAAVEDWPEMRARALQIAREVRENPPPVEEPEEAEETSSFLEWLAEDHFVFLGYREYELIEEEGEDALRAVPESGLGILRRERSRPGVRRFRDLPPEARKLVRAPYLLNLTKSNSRSTVHRPSYLDYVGIKRFKDGEVCGERRFLGLYTFSAYSSSVLEVPIVRRKVRRVLERAKFPPGSHNEKDLVEILETYPRDELFQISEDELFEIATGILHLRERQRVRLFVRRDTYGRFLSCLVFVPRDRYDTDTRRRMEKILLEAFDGKGVEFNVRLSESVLARLHYIIYTDPAHPPEYDLAEVEAHLAEAARLWTDNLYEALLESLGEERGTELYHRYKEAFPASYQEEFLARRAVPDILRLEELESEQDLRMSLYHPLEAPEDALRFKLYRRGRPITLSEALPLLENMGVKVMNEHGPYEITPSGGERFWIHDFGLKAEGGLHTEEVREIFQEAFARLWRGEVEDDGFNRLVLGARLGWREVSLLRACCKYLRQTGLSFSQRYMEDTLYAHPDIARGLVELFTARFDPGRPRREESAEEIVSGIERALESVESLDEDRIIRSFLRLILAMTRTNYFQPGPPGEPGKPYISFKLDPQKVPGLPLPRPMFEIFVYSPRTEGVHLRGGRVARGGIRWSDRREDFRTEILGLMKAQMVKNAVIVPVGAKGGFVVKRPPEEGDRDALMREVARCYQTLIRGMLDLTDNLRDGEVVPPPRVVRHDGDDPYLVVAADKGTATFSDLANAISAEYGFWLGDAFASGGSTGYDHKKMGITARGAWESAKRHFRALGKDIQSEDFTVVGIGDMSGDVFGNGMLQSRHIKLVGAFDHRHVFLDPNPDPEKSYEERRRLFGLPRSSWADYDRSLISEGGGVFERTAKSVPLSPQARELLGVEEERLTPAEVINALLKAEVDMLFNGGVGTFVKASSESHAEVGDKANDALRADASELRCRVVVEGGNLGFTQRGRVEYAMRGGRIYTDAIDNSAGVDCSDHEVNIKILLDSVVKSGDMTVKQRNELLSRMEDEVASLVLRNNYLQTQAIDNSVAQANSMAEVHARYIRALEESGALDRELEHLPGPQELADRKAEGGGLTAPEFAVLLAYTKITLYDELLRSDVPEDPYLSHDLERYFPVPLRERYAGRMREHRLRREITATHLVNSMVNRCGTTFAYRLGEETGAAIPDIVRAYAAAREIFGMRALWEEIEGLDLRVPASTQTRMLLETRKLVERASRWLLRNRRPPLDIEAAISCFSGGARELMRKIPQLMPEPDREALREREARLAGEGVPEETAKRVALLDAMFSVLDIVDVSNATGRPLESAAAVYFVLGDRLRLHWLRRHIEALPRDNRWQTLARAALRDDLYNQQATLTAEVLRSTPEEPDAAQKVEGWIEAHRRPVERALQVLRDINSSGTFDLSTLPVALREVRNLITSSGVPETVEAAR
ncbi:NAD-glutamate dehydrogenase [Rubrobacter xylanophilus]|nr:NAD-glutamate dehydrogenase [Rubrobacter xylanophilus]